MAGTMGVVDELNVMISILVITGLPCPKAEL